jgi:hypothetical protein
VFGFRGGERVIPIAREAVKRYRALADPRGLYFALAGFVYAGLTFGEPGSEAERDAGAALAELDAIERPEWPARLRCWAIVARTRSRGDDYAARITSLRAMHELASAAGATERALTAEMNIIEALHKLRRTDEAIGIARSVIESGLLGGERLGVLLLNLAEALAGQGKTGESRDFASEGLRVLRQCNGMVDAFASLAEIALAEGRSEDAARLVGYASLLRAPSGIERGEQERMVNAISEKIAARIGTVQRDQLMNEGGRLTEAQATALALRVPTGIPAA